MGQAELRFSPVENGGLFSENFLKSRLPLWSDYKDLDCKQLMEDIRSIWDREGPALPGANEAQVEEHCIQPILDLLGHSWTPQAGYSTPSGRSVPDYALFLSDEARLTAGQQRKNSLDRFQNAVAIAEAKEFERPFNTRRGGTRNEDPHAQILRYLNETRAAWGILTNGRTWRLYSYEKATQGYYYGVDLAALLEREDAQEFRRFAAFFSRSALEPDERDLCLLDRMLREAERSAVAVGDALERQVFQAIPLLATGLLGDEDRSDSSLARAFENSLVFLYRMLFCLHAEARGLLPIDNPHYEPQSLLQVRLDVARQRDAGATYSERSDRLYSMLRALFRIVDEGEPAFRVNAYNGGLFSPSEHRYFEGRTIPDPKIAPAIDLLSRIDGEFVDFRELSVRHLGTIYEKLLAYQLTDRAGTLQLRESPLKHRSGSYFTPERVVDAIVARTLEPVLMRASEEIAAAGFSGTDALARFLDLKICDPAVGSGHFLVAAVEYVTQFIATDPSYSQHPGEQLLELAEIRRLVAERCIYGVDINPMAVELARLSLWLATVDREQPLTFLENLRAGNSIVGTSIQDLLRGGESVFSSALARHAEELLKQRAEIVAQPSSTTKEVHEKEEIANAAEALREPIEEFADETLGVPLGDPEIGDPFHWDVEFPEVFLTAGGSPLQDAGFDAIIGNPPYIQIQSLGRATAEFCRERYSVAAGAFDVYVVFIERALELLGPDSRLGFIVPNKFTKLEMAKGLRELLIAQEAVEEILDFGGAQLFGATNYTAILLLETGRSRSAVTYRKLGDAEGEPIAQIEKIEPSEFRYADLGKGPWILATPSEQRIIKVASTGAESLEGVTKQIFQGLITSADKVFHFKDLGLAGPLRRVQSKASGRAIELEPDLLHQLASGTDVRRYAFAPLRTLLLFPYGGDGTKELLDWEVVEALPRTAAYLREHEETLRGREGGKMDHAGWYGYVYPKNLGAHELPKLGIPRLCERLRVGVDPSGGTYLDNVDVNGVLPLTGGPSVWQLLVLLNSQLLDFLFKLRTVPFRGDYMSANKQFVAPLPIKALDGFEVEMDGFGMRLNEISVELETERAAFLDWTMNRINADPRSLPGKTKLSAYESHPPGELLGLLAKSAKQLGIDPRGRAFRDEFVREHSASAERISALCLDLERTAVEADSLVYDLYGIAGTDRQLVAAKYLTN